MKLLSGSLALIFSLALSVHAFAQAPAPQGQAIKLVKPGLYMVTGGGGNVVVRVTPAGLVVVDTKNPGQALYDDLMAQIRTVSAAPVKYVIDTHHHYDHTGNNGRFRDAGATVVAQAGLPALLDKYVHASHPDLLADLPKLVPTVVYDKSRSIVLGGLTVRLMHFASGHTGADTIVYFPDLKAVAMGDELMGATPNFDYPGGASVVGWISSLDQVLKLDWDVAIPGHGDLPMTRAEVQAFRGKMQKLLDRARERVKAGTPKDQLIASIRADDLWVWSPNTWPPARVDGLWTEAGGQ